MILRTGSKSQADVERVSGSLNGKTFDIDFA